MVKQVTRPMDIFLFDRSVCRSTAEFTPLTKNLEP